MPILSYLHVTKQFAPDAYGVMDVNFTVDPGELVVITGHTGSGKTTLMKLLTREYTVSEGELYFNDTPVHALKSNKVHLHRRQIGVVYQDYRLIKDLTVWENVALPLYIAGKKEAEIEQQTSDLLNLVKLQDKYDLFPNQLSGGEAQRVSIARSLALAPELIFADEPTGNLDVDTSKAIALLLAKINELGTTVLLSTHDVTLLDIFTGERHIQLEKGSIVADSGAQKPKATSSAPSESTTSEAPANKTTEATAPSTTAQTSTQPMPESTSRETSSVAAAVAAAPAKKQRFWHRLGLGKTTETSTPAVKQKPEATAEQASDSASEQKSDHKTEHKSDQKDKHQSTEKTKHKQQSAHHHKKE